MMYQIEKVTPDRLMAALDYFVALLQDVVAGGASVGFLPPLGAEEARAYWQQVAAAVESGGRVLLAAVEDGRPLGTVQLDLARMPNGRHRAEVIKLLVHRSARRRGIGRALMLEAEHQARAAGRTLLVLDTRVGDAAEQLYLRLGYCRAGVIPRYARGASGSLEDTVFFYRELEAPGDTP